MSKLIENYIAVTEGKLSKAEFLRQTRQLYPGYINQFTSYSDAIQIFKNRGILLENVVGQPKEESVDIPLEQIDRGVRFELEKEKEQCCNFEKAKQKAIANLKKDPLYYSGVQQTDKQTELAVKKAIKESAEDRESFTEKDKIMLQLVPALMQKVNPETGKKYTHVEAKAKAKKMIKAKQKGVETTKKVTNKDQQQQLLKENIEKVIVKVLTEAATVNLAKLSDENATIQGIPGILNSLENVVTEIESFIIKEQAKIQNIFDQIGNIKNEDNIPIGHKFVKPILNSLVQDLQPVLEKINLDNLKLPEAPVLNNTENETEISGDDMEQADSGGAEYVEKASIYRPRGLKPNPLSESRYKRTGRYTK